MSLIVGVVAEGVCQATRDRGDDWDRRSSAPSRYADDQESKEQAGDPDGAEHAPAEFEKERLRHGCDDASVIDAANPLIW